MRQNKGFSFIELIVVVTIILVVSIAGMVSYGESNKKARDGRRTADLEKIRIALELYKQGEGSTYPAAIDNLRVEGYLDSLPSDPKSGYTYVYVKGGAGPSLGYSYTVSAHMETTSMGNYGTCGTVTCNYQVTSP